MNRYQLLTASILLAALTQSIPAQPNHQGHQGLSQKDWSCAIATSKALQAPMTHAGLIDQNKIDNDKTGSSLLAEEKLPRGAMRRVFLLTLHETGGRTVSVIAQSKSASLPGTSDSDYQCPYVDTKGYVISKVL